MGKETRNFDTLNRIVLLDKLLQKNGGVSLKQIQEQYSERLDIWLETRTVKEDIKRLRKGFAGEFPEIRVLKNKYYVYKDINYSVFGNPLTQSDAEVLKEIQILLRKQTNFELSEKLTEILKKFKGRFYDIDPENTDVVVFEQVADLKGTEHLETIFKALTRKKVLKIKYCAFDNDTEKTLEIHPLQLRQNKNRWLLIGRDNKGYEPIFLGVDRILKCRESDTRYRSFPFDINKYFEEMIGVSIPEKEEVLEIKLLFTPLQAKYAFSKPVHHTLKEVKKTNKGVYATLSVKPNYELYQWLLSMGNAVKVLSPKYIIDNLDTRQKSIL